MHFTPHVEWKNIIMMFKNIYYCASKRKFSVLKSFFIFTIFAKYSSPPLTQFSQGCFNFGNKIKSQDTRSGEQGGRGGKLSDFWRKENEQEHFYSR